MVGLYTTSGTPLDTSLISGLSTPIGIAVVPEPTTLLATFPLAADVAPETQKRNPTSGRQDGT
jgi:hypothetical protein